MSVKIVLGSKSESNSIRLLPRHKFAPCSGSPSQPLTRSLSLIQSKLWPCCDSVTVDSQACYHFFILHPLLVWAVGTRSLRLSCGHAAARPGSPPGHAAAGPGWPALSLRLARPGAPGPGRRVVLRPHDPPGPRCPGRAALTARHHSGRPPPALF